MDENPSLAEREKLRKKDLEMELDPATGLKQPGMGVQLSLSLALPYLEQDRLDEAEALFARLAKINKVPEYHTLGLLGEGIVLALRDRPRESMQRFWKVQPRKEEVAKGRVLQNLLHSNRDLVKWVAEAADHNKANLGPASRLSPPWLNRLLNPNAKWPGGKPRGDKKPGSK